MAKRGRGKARTKPKPSRGTPADQRLAGRGKKPGPKPKGGKRS